MKKQVVINEAVTVTALSFRERKGLVGFPKRMEYGGATYMFQDGLQCLIKKGNQIFRIFDMQDGQNGTYRLRCDERQLGWTLLAMTQE